MKRQREIVSSIDLQQLLQKFEALSIVVREEMPDVLQADVRVPHRFAKPGKISKKADTLSSQHR